PIAYVEFIAGVRLPVYDDGRRQYVLGDDGEPICGVWYIYRGKSATCDHRGEAAGRGLANARRLVRLFIDWRTCAVCPAALTACRSMRTGTSFLTDAGRM